MIRNKNTLISLDILSSEKDRAYMNDYTRDIMRFRLHSTYEIVLAFFTDGAVLEDVQEVDGAEVITSLSDYCIAGDITDHRDGTFTVVMGAMTEDEKKLSATQAEHEEYKESVNIILPLIDDETALYVKPLFPVWESGIEYAIGERFTYNGELYKVAQNHTSQSDWLPDNDTESLYERIDETHAGTLEDAIPYNGNMALENGKYYVENDVVYVCTRDSENAVYHALSELVGTYVELA